MSVIVIAAKELMIMTAIFARAAQKLRNALTVDPVAARHLEKIYVDVALRSRLWGV